VARADGDFQNLAFMYEQKFKTFAQNVQIAAGMGPKCQILFGLPIRPQKTLNFVRTGPLGLKNS
jgi:hypothetical protein